MSQLFASGGQSTEPSASALVLPMNIQGWLTLGLTGLISLLSNRLSSLLQHHSSKESIFWCSAFFMVQFSHLHLTIGKNMALTLVSKVLSLLLNMLSRFVRGLLPMIKCLNFMVAVTIHCALEPKKIQSVTLSIFSPFICHKLMWLNAMILVFWTLSLSQLFHSPLSPSSRGSFTSSSFSAIRVVSSTQLRRLIFLPEILIPACESLSWEFHMISSAYKLNKPPKMDGSLCRVLIKCGSLEKG